MAYKIEKTDTLNVRKSGDVSYFVGRVSLPDGSLTGGVHIQTKMGEPLQYRVVGEALVPQDAPSEQALVDKITASGVAVAARQDAKADMRAEARAKFDEVLAAVRQEHGADLFEGWDDPRKAAAVEERVRGNLAGAIAKSVDFGRGWKIHDLVGGAMEGMHDVERIARYLPAKDRSLYPVATRPEIGATITDRGRPVVVTGYGQEFDIRVKDVDAERLMLLAGEPGCYVYWQAA